MVNRLSKTCTALAFISALIQSGQCPHNYSSSMTIISGFFPSCFTWETALNPAATNILIPFSCSHLCQPVICHQSCKYLEISCSECSYSYVCFLVCGCSKRNKGDHSVFSLSCGGKKKKSKGRPLVFLQEEEGEEAILQFTFYFLFPSNSCLFIKRLSLLSWSQINFYQWVSV